MLQNLHIRMAIAISFGAIPGALSRYFIGELTKAISGKDFGYYGTFFVNVVGCFIIAFYFTLNEQRFKNWSPELRLIVTTGFCGALTTFSTYGLDTAGMLQKGDFNLALFYWAGSMIIGMIAVLLGVSFARKLCD